MIAPNNICIIDIVFIKPHLEIMLEYLSDNRILRVVAIYDELRMPSNGRFIFSYGLLGVLGRT